MIPAGQDRFQQPCGVEAIRLGMAHQHGRRLPAIQGDQGMGDSQAYHGVGVWSLQFPEELRHRFRQTGHAQAVSTGDGIGGLTLEVGLRACQRFQPQGLEPRSKPGNRSGLLAQVDRWVQVTGGVQLHCPCG